MKNNRKKKAFTLTELLVVVIVIGVLSAVVLPKFSKVIETRKTTEAEEMMAAVRTEQEKRCSLDKNYTTDAAAVNLASLNTKNFNYTLKNTGIEAASTGKYGYTLKMPSYRDGRLCCDSAEQCAKLNKNYPLCSELTAKADYTSGAECAADVPETPDPTYECTASKVVSRSCQTGCGTETRSATCNTSNGQWEYGAWNISACTPEPAAETKECGAGYSGTQTRSAVCKNDAWVMGDWTGTCTPTCDMTSDAVLYRAQNCEMGGHNPNWKKGVWSTDTCSCTCPAGTTMDEEGACIVITTCDMTSDDVLNRAQSCEAGAHNPNWKKGVWSTDTCSCTCPTGTTIDEEGACIVSACQHNDPRGNLRNSCERSSGTWNLDICDCVCPAGTTYQRGMCVNSSCGNATYKATHKSECCPSAPTTDTVCWKMGWTFESEEEIYWFPSYNHHSYSECEPSYPTSPCPASSCVEGNTCTYLSHYGFWNVGDTDCVGTLVTERCDIVKNGW